MSRDAKTAQPIKTVPALTIAALIDDMAAHLARANIWIDPSSSAFDEACLLVLWTLDMPYETLDNVAQAPVDPEQAVHVHRLVSERIHRQIPAAYLIRECWFQGVPFYIDERTCVPRSLIGELIVSGALDTWLHERSQRVLDLGTGNGSLAVLAALMWHHVQIDAADISHDALEVARMNVQRHGQSDRITLIKSDVLAHVRGPYDLILCNPPHFSSAEYSELPNELRVEPHQALHGGADGMDFIRELLRHGLEVLSAQGGLVLEIGHARSAFEAAFPNLKGVWLHTHAGFDQVVLVSRDALMRWRSTADLTQIVPHGKAHPEAEATPTDGMPMSMSMPSATTATAAAAAPITVMALVDAMASRLHSAGVSFGHGTTNAFDEAAWLTLWALNKPVNELDQVAQMVVAPEQAIHVRQVISERISRRIPAAYLTREAWLQGVAFYVDERVIIPRSFIAELIAYGSIDAWLTEQTRHVLDLCTGNGSLAVLAAMVWPEVVVDAADLSRDALDVARINVQRHGLSQRITLIESNGLTQVRGPYDLILCNPPYVNSSSMARLPAEYLAEPRMALEGGSDGMDFIRNLLRDVLGVMSEEAVLVLEIGNERPHYDLAFPELETVWLDTTSGTDQVALISHEALVLWLHH
jgi:ribosomal protein L3 glutamine methyltransferase